MKIGYSEVVAFYLAALAIRTSYELLKKAGRLGPRSHTIFAFIFLDMIVLWASWFSMSPMEPERLVGRTGRQRNGHERHPQSEEPGGYRSSFRGSITTCLIRSRFHV